ncbi:hypothetical protein Plhal304r1_c018g0063981 [Plasmopara halstedii]
MKLVRLLYCLLLLSTLALLSFYDTEAVELLASNAAPKGKLKPISSRIWNRIKNTKLVQKGMELMHRKDENIKLGEKDKKWKPKMKLKYIGLFFISIFTKVLFLKSLKPSMYLRLAYNKREAIKTLFNDYEVGSVTSNIFASSQFKKWFAVINEAYFNNPHKGHERTLDALITMFGKERTYKDLAKAWKFPSERNGVLIDNTLICRWAKKGMDHPSVLQDFLEWFRYRSMEDWYNNKILASVLEELEMNGYLYGFSDMVKTMQTRVEDEEKFTARVKYWEGWKKKDDASDDALFYLSDFHLENIKILLTSKDVYHWYDFMKKNGGDAAKLLQPLLFKQLSEEKVALLLSVVAKEYEHPLGKETLEAVFNVWKEQKNDHLLATRLVHHRVQEHIFESEEMYVLDACMQFCHKSDSYKFMYEALSSDFGRNLDQKIAEAVKSGNVIATKLSKIKSGK